jgi:hypothetical protein
MDGDSRRVRDFGEAMTIWSRDSPLGVCRAETGLRIIVKRCQVEVSKPSRGVSPTPRAVQPGAAYVPGAPPDHRIRVGAHGVQLVPGPGRPLQVTGDRQQDQHPGLPADVWVRISEHRAKLIGRHGVHGWHDTRRLRPDQCSFGGLGHGRVRYPPTRPRLDRATTTMTHPARADRPGRCDESLTSGRFRWPLRVSWLCGSSR